MRRIVDSLVIAGGLVAAASAPVTAQTVQEHVAGLKAPAKLLALPAGELLVAEAGDGPNTGRISYIDRDARRFTVIDGLPSARFLGRDPGGPNGLLLLNRTLYVTIGAGDTTITGAGQGSEIPNPQVSSPLFSSVLALEFPDAAGQFSLGFTLQRPSTTCWRPTAPSISTTLTARRCAWRAWSTSPATCRSRVPTSRVTYGSRIPTDWSGARLAWRWSTRR